MLLRSEPTGDVRLSCDELGCGAIGAPFQSVVALYEQIDSRGLYSGWTAELLEIRTRLTAPAGMILATPQLVMACDRCPRCAKLLAQLRQTKMKLRKESRRGDDSTEGQELAPASG